MQKETSAIDSKVGQSLLRSLDKKREMMSYLVLIIWKRNAERRGKNEEEERKEKSRSIPECQKTQAKILRGIVLCILKKMDSLQEQLSGQKQLKQSFSGHILYLPSIKGHH